MLAEGGRQLGIALANAGKMFGPERIVLVLAPEVRVPSFQASFDRALADEYAYGDATAPGLVSVAADSDVFTRGAGYDMITELFLR